MPLTFRQFLFTFLFVLIASYAAYQLRGIWLGPRILISSPIPGESLSEPLLIIKGQAERADKIFLNGRKILPDQDGYFSEKTVIAQGYTIIELTAEDRFGRLTEVKLPVVLNNHDQG
jgi:hypothetical protein